MKKLIVMLTVCLFAVTGKVSAQAGTQVQSGAQLQVQATPSAGKVSVHDISITKATQSTAKIGPGQVVFAGANTNEGTNNLTKAGVGTLQFTKRGNTIINVIFIDNAGNSFKLKPEPGTTASLPGSMTWEIKANVKTGFFRFYGDVD